MGNCHNEENNSELEVYSKFFFYNHSSIAGVI